MPKERLLIHGPGLHDLTDLLHFDKIVYPTTTAIRRPRNLPPGYAGYPVEEPLPQAVRDKLGEAGLIVSPGEVLFAPAAGDFTARLTQGTEALNQWIQQSGIELGRVLGEIAFSSLDTPASANEVTAWLHDIDAKTRRLADLAVKAGHRAVPKFYVDDVTGTLKPGWSLVLSVMFLRFPRVEVGRVGLDELIVFLSDTGTTERRQALFDWLTGIESTVENGQVTVENASYRTAQLLDDYSGWIMGSGLPSRLGVSEFLLIFGASLIERLTAIALPEDADKILAFSQRGLSLMEEDVKTSGRELAYLSHSKRGYAD